MKSTAKIAVFGFIGAFLVFGPGPVALAGSHTWEPWAVFTNADGTIQFVEIKETHNGTAEGNLQLHTVIMRPSGTTSASMHFVPGNTAQTYYLLGTAAYAALPGAPPLDQIIPDNFITIATDNALEYSSIPSVNATWTAGTIPTNGVDFLTRLAPSPASPVVQANVATNYAGVTGCVDASGAAPVSLPGVPDGTNGTSMKAGKLAPNGSSISVTWDTGTCTDANDHQIIFGQKTGFPAKAGGLYTLQGGACSIGSVSPYTWTPTPSSSDGSGLIWFLVVTTDGAGTEGPWGTFNGVNDRNGSGARCSSGVCATTNKSLAGTCGH